MRILVKVAWLFVIFLFIPAVGVQAEETVTVKAQGKALLSDYTTPIEARVVALNNARRVALTEAITGKQADPLHVYTAETVDTLLGYVARGVIVEEKVTKGGWEPASDGRMFWSTNITAKVKSLDGGKLSPLGIEKAVLTPVGTKKAEDNPVFHAGTELQVRVMVKEAAYVYIFAVDRYGNAFTIYPNQYGGKLALKKGKELVYPPGSLIVRGVKLRALPPKGFKESKETVLVVATKRNTEFLEGVEHGTITDLMAELSSLERAEWTAKTIGYTIEGGH